MRQSDGEMVRSQSAPRTFTSSALFMRTFDEGMALVEETATYLDGPGRAESKKLERSAALAYATESMRLTTRLMQLAYTRYKPVRYVRSNSPSLATQMPRFPATSPNFRL